MLPGGLHGSSGPLTQLIASLDRITCLCRRAAMVLEGEVGTMFQRYQLFADVHQAVGYLVGCIHAELPQLGLQRHRIAVFAMYKGNATWLATGRLRQSSLGRLGFYSVAHALISFLPPTKINLAADSHFVEVVWSWDSPCREYDCYPNQCPMLQRLSFRG